MKITIPEQLKADLPLTFWGKVLTATPVIMTVIATLLAGLASSEMTRAQYERALAAQQQSKAGDQWSFFQAKRLRGAMQRNSLDLLQGLSEVHALDESLLKQSAAQLPKESSAEMLAWLNSSSAAATLRALNSGELPAVPPRADPPARVRDALSAVENLRPDSEITAILAQIDTATLQGEILAGRDQALAFDAATKPVNQAIDKLDALLSKQVKDVGKDRAVSPASDLRLPTSVLRDFTAGRMRYSAARYEVEARLNQNIANIYELQVRKSNISAERHHRRSQRFFFGMLAAQAAVIVATFAIAAKKRNFLWTIAAVAGLAAIALAIYVYLYV